MKNIDIDIIFSKYLIFRQQIKIQILPIEHSQKTMSTIYLTQNPQYHKQFPNTALVQSSQLQLFTIIQPYLSILPQPYHINIYSFKNNLPKQYQLPVKIGEQLLKYLQNHEQVINKDISLSINNQLYYQISYYSDYTSVITSIQQYINDHELEQSTVFIIKYYNYTIKYILLKQPQQSQYQTTKQLIRQLQLKYNTQLQSQTPIKSQAILIIYIDDINDQKFKFWTKNQLHQYGCQYNQILHQKYVKIKQQIDKEINIFRDKISMIETALGESINIDKLISDEKQNHEFKRLRQTFSIITNLQNIIKQQEKEIENKKISLKQKRKQKYVTQFNYIKLLQKKKLQLGLLKKQLIQIQYRNRYAIKHQSAGQKFNSFAIREDALIFAKKQHQKYANILHKLNNSHNNKQNIYQIRNMQNHQNRSHTYKSLHKSQKKSIQNHRYMLTKKYNQLHLNQQSKKQNQQLNLIAKEIIYFQNLLTNVANYCQLNWKLLEEIKGKGVSQQKHHHQITNPSLFSTTHQPIQFPFQQYPVLNQLLSLDPPYYNIDKLLSRQLPQPNNLEILDEYKNVSTLSINNKYPQSHCTIQSNKYVQDNTKFITTSNQITTNKYCNIQQQPLNVVKNYNQYSGSNNNNNRMRIIVKPPKISNNKDENKLM